MEKEIVYKKKKTLGSYPYFSVIFSITMALFVIGLFGILILHTNKLTTIIKENIELHIYLKNQIPENEKIKIEKTLASKPYINQINASPLINFISKDEAAAKFIKDTGEDFIKFLGENPLRDAYVIRIKPEFYNDADLKRIKKDILTISGVFEVVYQETLVNVINDNIAKLSIILLSFALLLVFVVIILINSTIKLALFSQRMLIRSMQLVGATKGFIQKPFLFRAALHGLLSGIFASILLYGLLMYAYSKIEDLSILREIDKTFIVFGFLCLLGSVIGFLSAFRSVRKYLKLSLDELY